MLSGASEMTCHMVYLPICIRQKKANCPMKEKNVVSGDFCTTSRILLCTETYDTTVNLVSNVTLDLETLVSDHDRTERFFMTSLFTGTCNYTYVTPCHGHL